MRNPTRIPRILKEIQQIWEKYPDLRLCQLLVNVIETSNIPVDPYFIEDDRLEDALRFYKVHTQFESDTRENKKHIRGRE